MKLDERTLIQFFEEIGAVRSCEIVRDRNSKRSKGVGYVEFVDEAVIPDALKLTGRSLMGIPIIAQLAEAEKNSQPKTTDGAEIKKNGTPFHRLYVGNIHFNVTVKDLENIFSPFGELMGVTLEKDIDGKSRGYGFIQYATAEQAKECLESMNGFNLANRRIRVGFGNERFTSDSTASLLRKFDENQNAEYQRSSFFGKGGRGPHAGGTDRARGRDNHRTISGASALDDTDVAGVNFSNFSRDSLMRKLAREEAPVAKATTANTSAVRQPPPAPTRQPSGCIVLHNCFDAEEEQTRSNDDEWIKDLESDVRTECEEKYGHVEHIKLDPNESEIYIRFDRVQGGENAIKGLNGRFFGGRTITAASVVEAHYASKFGRSTKN